ncbi:MAG: hypothetical protein E7491_03210 [Ruminococcaceae bacterium]|nr:hypothetical protein [Oscillospiraceae bacterium]
MNDNEIKNTSGSGEPTPPRRQRPPQADGSQRRPMRSDSPQRKKKRRKKKNKATFGQVIAAIFGWIVKFVLNTIVTFVLIGLIAGSVVLSSFAVYINDYIVPIIKTDISNLALNETSIIYAVNDDGSLYEMQRLYSEENRIWVEYDDIPKDMGNAFIAIEDERFWQHSGVDWKRTLGASLSFVFGGSDFGGSTITQQLIKNVTNDRDVKATRKIREIARALYLENEYDKKVILEAYMNVIHLGAGCNGVQSAAYTYFGKDVSELTLAECAAIAGITQYPVKYNPLIYPENNKERQQDVLWKMRQLGMISEEEYDEALAQELVFVGKKQSDDDTPIKTSNKQSYAVDAVIFEVLEDLQNEKGYSKAMARKLLYSGGLRIYTTFDMNVQTAMEEIFTDDANFPDVVSSKGEAPQAAMIVMDQYSGAVKGVIGGRGEKEYDLALNRAIDSYLPSGSTIKPLSAFAPAIELGYITYCTVLDDVPVIFEETSMWPKNYYTDYYGLMTVQEAVEISCNTVPGYIVNNMLGVETSFEFLTESFRFDHVYKTYTLSNGTTTSDMLPAPLALGGLTKGMSPAEICSAYCTFSNQGIYNGYHTYTHITDSEGNTVMEKNIETFVSMSEETANIVHSLLRTVTTEGTGTSAVFRKDIPLAGKTGTTSNDQDRWFVGYSPYYTAATWFGYDKPDEIKGVSGNPALKLWKAVMEKIHADLDARDFDEYSPKIITAEYCVDSGKMPCDYCKMDPRGNRIKTGYFVQGTEPSEPCDRHIPVKVCNISNRIAHEGCPDEVCRTVALLNYRRDLPATKFDTVLVKENEVLEPGTKTTTINGKLYKLVEVPLYIYTDDAQYIYLQLPSWQTIPEIYDQPTFASLYAGGTTTYAVTKASAPMNFPCAYHGRAIFPATPTPSPTPVQPDWIWPFG